MSFKDIKSKLRNERGFTIVELLIVIVVIGILAAITIVSYTGITSRANAASAKATAATVQKKAELYVADGPTSKYPIQASDFTSDSAKSYYMTTTNPNWSFAASTAAVTATTGTNTVVIRKCAAGTPASQAAIDGTNITGLQIFFWDYAAGTVTTSPVVVGSNTADTITCPATAGV